MPQSLIGTARLFTAVGWATDATKAVDYTPATQAFVAMTGAVRVLLVSGAASIIAVKDGDPAPLSAADHMPLVAGLPELFFVPAGYRLSLFDAASTAVVNVARAVIAPIDGPQA